MLSSIFKSDEKQKLECSITDISNICIFEQQNPKGLKIQRSSGEIQSNWFILRCSISSNNTVKMYRLQNGERLEDDEFSTTINNSATCDFNQSLSLVKLRPGCLIKNVSWSDLLKWNFKDIPNISLSSSSSILSRLWKNIFY